MNQKENIALPRRRQKPNSMSLSGKEEVNDILGRGLKIPSYLRTIVFLSKIFLLLLQWSQDPERYIFNPP